ncbi:MAG: hypothetical protein ABI766_07265 [Gemmatimonadales bacterium]
MSQVTAPSDAHEPSLRTVELVCEKLGELDLPIGPGTARDLIRAILEMEAPRVEAHVRDALQTALETIRVATQSALGVLTTTERIPPPPVLPEPPKPVLERPINRKTPAQGSRIPALRTSGPRRKPGEHSGERPRPPMPAPEPPRQRDEFDGDADRPVFRRPRGR